MASRMILSTSLTISKSLERLILDNAPIEALRAEAVSEGMITLRASALEKMKNGLIPLEQVLADSIE